MLRILAAAALTVVAPAARAEPRAVTLLSDVDDTVKITHVTSPMRAVVRGLARNAVFAGMATLYREMNAELVFLSASPTFLEGRLRRTLVERAGFPPARFVLRRWGAEPDIGAFKRRWLGTIARESPVPVILVGDDTERDPELFLAAAKELPPGRVTVIYIRRNLHRPLPPGVIAFLTAYDLAMHEVAFGRLAPEAALRVGEATLAGEGNRGRRLLPPFYRCPREPPPTTLPEVNPGDARLVAMRDRIHARTRELCAVRAE